MTANQKPILISVILVVVTSLIIGIKNLFSSPIKSLTTAFNNATGGETGFKESQQQIVTSANKAVSKAPNSRHKEVADIFYKHINSHWVSDNDENFVYDILLSKEADMPFLVAVIAAHAVRNYSNRGLVDGYFTDKNYTLPFAFEQIFDHDRQEYSTLHNLLTTVMKNLP